MAGAAEAAEVMQTVEMQQQTPEAEAAGRVLHLVGGQILVAMVGVD
jgi:hypothetical protein